MSQAVEERHQAPEACASCGAKLHGRFCSQCGEKALDHHDLSLAHFLGHAFHDVAHFDTKIFRTLKRLLAAPGGLTADWLAGRRVGFLSPVQLFLLVNVAFFFVTPRINIIPIGYRHLVQNQRVLWSLSTHDLVEKARGSRPEEELAKEFDAEVTHVKKLFVFVMVFLMSLVLFAGTLGRRTSYVAHLVFSLHYYAFWMVMMVGIPLALGAGAWVCVTVHRALSGGTVRVAIGDTVLIPLSFLVSGIYLFLAVRRVYGSRPLAATLQAAALSVAMLAIFVVYRDSLYLLVLQLV